ncbi:MAG: bifunctional phosphopantothenoylcysteine decarboxylase/phosphopantothenate--cysteine ligase CoaBC [Thermoleophilaceae bacterium]
MARLLLGVTGGISAYKAVQIARLAIKAEHAVRVIQTPASLNFVGRATFEAITGAPALVDEFEQDPARGAFPGDPQPAHAPISHLALVEGCDAYAIAPASANTIAKLATGLADNLLTSAALALESPLLIAPAMNERMWRHFATRANVEALRARGATIVPPATGALASHGEWGEGRLAEPAAILAAVEQRLAGGYAPRSLDGLRLLVTAGGTREPIDAVRYVGNRSSGKMGVALASEATRRGAEVTLVAANVALARPPGVRWIEVETAAELERETIAASQSAQVVVMAAAVADFRPAGADPGKISKSGRTELTLELEATTDILAELGRRRRPGQVLIGFAAEHGEGGRARARKKLERKRLDAVVLNDVSRAGIGFDAEHNEVVVISHDGETTVPRAAKAEVAKAILDTVEQIGALAAVKDREGSR